MSVPKGNPIFTPEAYLEWEKVNDTRHEYLNGEVFAMVGVKDSHATVAGNLFTLIHSHIKGTSYRVYMSDMKAYVEPAQAYFYPDIMVTCDPRDKGLDYFKQHPLLIIEVLSDSTAAFDRGNKFSVYRQLESLREYVLIDPDSPIVDCFRKDQQGHWVLYPYTRGDTVELTTINLRIPLEALYEGVEQG